MSAYTTVLVGTDGSESHFRAVDRAAAVAKDAGAALILVTAYHPMSAREVQAASDALGGEAYKVSGSHHAETVLRDACELATRIGVEDTETMALEGDPVDELARVAEERDVDLVVVGNRGLNSLTGRLLGSVPANISHRATCDVLIVHTTGRGAKQ